MDAFADRVDDADHLMAGNARVLDAGKQAQNRHHVAMADAASQDAKAHLFRTRDRNVPLFRLERPAFLPNDHRAHFRHCLIPFDRDEPSVAAG